MKPVFVLLTLVISVMGKRIGPNGLVQTKLEDSSSCNELYKKDPSLPSGVYKLMVGLEEVPVYCYMGDFGCGYGGWTTVIKLRDTEQTFIYDSILWTNRQTYNLEGGKTEPDRLKTKLPTYWSTPFTKISLWMNVDQENKFVVINQQVSSPYSLIADGQYRPTTLGRDTWKSLIGPEASVQTGCSREGFNVKQVGNDPLIRSRARIGIIADNNFDCTTPDSRIGFGTGALHDISNSCGNDAPADWFPDNGEVHIKAMWCILVK